MGNTLDSHCLIEWAGTQGKQDEVVEELFKRYVRPRPIPAAPLRPP